MNEHINSAEICALCGDNRALPDVEVCSLCSTDARILGRTAEIVAPKAHRQAIEETPDWASRKRQAQESGEVFEDSYRGDGL